MDINNTPCTDNATPVLTSAGTPVVSVNPYAKSQVMTKKPAREFSKKETLFAFFCYVSAYLFCLSIPSFVTPLGAFIVVLLTYLSTFIVMLTLNKKPKLMPVLVALSAVATSASLVVSSNGFLHYCSFTYAVYAYCYFLYGMSSDNIFRFKDSIILDFIKAIFILPFSSILDIFKAMFSGRKNKSGKVIAKVLLGVLLAVIPTIIIFALLSYDESFIDLFDSIFTFDSENILEHILSLVFAVPVGAYVFGIYVSSNDKKVENVLKLSECKKLVQKLHIAPVITVFTAVLPILFVYVMFFISQWQYYISGFTGVLPKDFSYAEYAREGFFQLCVVSVINLIILVFVSVLMKRKEGKKPYILNVVSIVFSVFTLVLISTAMAKMYMYIDCYGLTPLRVYASWFMVVLTLVFVLIIVKQFAKKLRLVVISLAVLVVMFSALSLSNVDSFIAKYNVDRYLDGSLETVDIPAMENLGDAAIPHLVRLSQYLDEKNGTDITKMQAEIWENEYYSDMDYALVAYLKHKASYIKTHEYSLYEYTIPKYKAQKALEEIGLLDKK